MEPIKYYINDLDLDSFFHIFLTVTGIHVSKMSTKSHKNHGENSLLQGCIHEVIALIPFPAQPIVFLFFSFQALVDEE